MRQPSIVIKKRVNDYLGLLDLCARVIAALTGSAVYITPIPALVLLGTSMTALQNSYTLWSSAGKRGSPLLFADLKEKALALKQLLKAELDYCQNVAIIAAGNDNAALESILAGSGFYLKNPSNPQGPLEKVQNFHNFVSRTINRNDVKLKWTKLLNCTMRSNVKSYKIYRGTTNVFSAATLLDTITKSSYVATNTSSATVSWSFWIVAVGVAGDGAVSEDVTVNVPNA